MSDWDVKKIGEVMNVQRGGSPRPIKKYLTDSPDGLNWIKIGDASETDKYIYKTKQKITKDGLHKTRLVEEGDFLLSNSMSFGRPYIMKTRGCIHDGWLVLKDKQDEEINKDFLYYYLSSPVVFDQFDKLAAGSTVRNLNIRLVSSVEIPIPPLSEQKRIVATLEEAFEAIFQAKVNIIRNIENAEELFQSKLKDTFDELYNTYESSTIGKKFNTSAGGTPKKSHKDYYENGDIPWLRSGEVKQGDILQTEMFITEKGLSESSAKLFPENTVLVAMYGATAGDVGILRLEASTNQAVCGILPNDDFTSEFIYYLINYKREMLVKQAIGNAQPNLSQTKIKKLEIPLVPITVQKKVVSEIGQISDTVDELVLGYNKQAESLEELKKSILQKAFSGELTANETVTV